MAYLENQAFPLLPALIFYGENYTEIDRAIVDVLNIYIGTPHGSRAEAAAAIDRIRLSRGYHGVQGSTRSALIFVHGFWPTFLKCARQIPCNEAAQGYLVAVVNELRALPSSNPVTRNPWRGLPGLGGSIRNAYHEPTVSPSQYQRYEEWINLNAFVARLYGNELVGCYGLGIKAMSRAFENRPTRGSRIQTWRVRAAAQWMFYSSNKLFAVMTTGRPRLGDGHSHSSTRFSGARVYSFDRWMFWKQSFRNLSIGAGDDATVAVEVMDRADGRQRL
ncbi:hypothetical protein F4814DRAFT_426555 [Daldinia grandis]|nr:hypothetical protein F4814DRAFT_426555 [Daldinia grandis]